MRLTVNLESDVYALAKSLAKAEDSTISAAVNQLVRRSISVTGKPGSQSSRRPVRRNGFIISRGRRPVTADTVKQIEAEDDQA